MTAPPAPTTEHAVPATLVAEPGGVGLIAGSLGSLFALSLRQSLHGKRWMVVAALFSLPAALALLIRSTAPDVPSLTLEFSIVFMLIPQALLPLIAMLYASGMIQDEVEEQTITYVLIRPIPRWAMYLVKLAATLITTVVLASVFTAITYLAIYVGAGSAVEDVPWRCMQAVAIQALAVVTYCSIFGLVSVLTRRALLVCVAYSVIIEGVLANMPFSVRLATVIYYTRVVTYRALDFETLTAQGDLEDSAATLWGLTGGRELLEHPATATCLWILIGTSIACALLGALLVAGREFHVKTPEKE